MKPPHPKSFYFECVNRLENNNSIIIVKAIKDEKAIAFGFFLNANSTLFYMSGSSDYSYRKYAPNNLIQWYIINYANRNKIHLYDMGGAGKNSIDLFKKSFGGELISYHKIYWNTTTFRFSFWLYINFLKLFYRLKRKI